MLNYRGTKGGVTVDIRVVGKEEGSLSKEIGGGSHDELGGGIGFRRFGQCSMG